MLLPIIVGWGKEKKITRYWDGTSSNLLLVFLMGFIYQFAVSVFT